MRVIGIGIHRHRAFVKIADDIPHSGGIGTSPLRNANAALGDHRDLNAVFTLRNTSVIKLVAKTVRKLNFGQRVQCQKRHTATSFTAITITFHLNFVKIL